MSIEKFWTDHKQKVKIIAAFGGITVVSAAVASTMTATLLGRQIRDTPLHIWTTPKDPDINTSYTQPEL